MTTAARLKELRNEVFEILSSRFPDVLRYHKEVKGHCESIEIHDLRLTDSAWAGDSVMVSFNDRFGDSADYSIPLRYFDNPESYISNFLEEQARLEETKREEAKLKSRQALERQIGLLQAQLGKLGPA